MIIIPSQVQDSDILKQSLITGEDEFGRYIRRIKDYVSHDKTRFKREILENRLDNASNYFYKENVYGNIINESGNKYRCASDSSMYEIIDKTSGEIIKFGTNVPCPAPNPTSNSSYFIGEYGVPYPSIIFLDKGEAVESNIFNLKCRYDPYKYADIKNEINAYEDIYQLQYYDFIGFLSTFFTAWCWLYPFDAYIIIDCKTGTYNIPKFKYYPGCDKNFIKEVYLSLCRGISKVAIMMKRLCEINKRNFRIYSFIGNGGSIVKIKDYDRNDVDSMYNSPSDLASCIMKNSINGGLNYLCSEEYHLVKNLNSKPVTDEIVERTFGDMVLFGGTNDNYYDF